MTISPTDLLDPAYLATRAALIDRKRAGDPGHGAPKPGGTVYLTTADASGMMVSFIQSNYNGFGSGIVVPGTGISLQNRGFGFSLESGHPNEVAPRKRPLHTIIPGFVTDAAGAPVMSFGLMGGRMQAQGHLQMLLRVLRYRQNPQAAADAPRWRVVKGRSVAVEPEMGADTMNALKDRGHDISIEPADAFGFGGAQLILKGEDGTYVSGSDPRKDGHAVVF
jgi:gamma-glutamyltranspeptidase/glutathione hydrolase